MKLSRILQKNPQRKRQLLCGIGVCVCLMIWGIPAWGAVTAFSCSPTTIGQGETITCYVRTTFKYRTAAITYIPPTGLAIAPTSVYIGNIPSKTASFTIQAAALVLNDVTITITATEAGGSMSQTITINGSGTSSPSAITLTVPSPLNEGGTAAVNSNTTVTGTVELDVAPGAGNSVTVTITHDDSAGAVIDTSAGQFPPSGITATISGTATSADFDIPMVDDTTAGESDVNVTFTASATGLTGDTDSMTVTDDDSATGPTAITLSVPASLNEGGTADVDLDTTVTGTVSLDAAPGSGNSVTVTITHDDGPTGTVVDTSAGQFPSSGVSVTISGTDTTATFNIPLIDDTTTGEADVDVIFTATATGLTGDTDTMTVTDDDGTPSGPYIEITPSATTVADDGSTITFTVTRSTTGTAPTLTAEITAGGTAGSLSPTTLTFLNDTKTEVTETLTFTSTDVSADTPVTIRVYDSGGTYTEDSVTITVTDGVSSATSAPLELSVHGVPYYDGDTIIIYEGEVISFDVSGASTVLTKTDPSSLTGLVAFAIAGSPTSSLTLTAGTSFTNEMTTGTMNLTDSGNGNSLDLHVKAMKLYPMSGETFRTPTFFMTASFDWLHNFYDSNTEGKDTAYTDPDTDNFNKIIMVDSNLFPIYTALEGDQEFPNIVMRNWTTGPGGQSPSVNDYMNRSVAAVPDYINYTSYLFFGYGSHRAMKAIGMRSYMEWVYTVDPANNNFRRYKFVKLADDIVPPFRDDGLPYGDVEYMPTTGEHNVKKCDDCDPCHWYVGPGEDILCNTGSADTERCCYSEFTSSDSCYTELKDETWAFNPKTQDGTCGPDSNTGVYPSCGDAQDPTHEDYYLDMTTTNPGEGGAPSIQFPVMVKQSDIQAAGSGNVTVRFYFEAHTHDTSAGIALVVNKGAGSPCELVRAFGGNINNVNTFDGTWTLTSSDANVWNPDNVTFVADPTIKGGDFGTTPQSCNNCTHKVYEDFSLPASCVNNYYSSVYKYVTVDVYPCSGDGWVLKVPEFPEDPSDSAFRIPVAGVDGVDTSGMTATQIEELIEKRWANIDGYLDVVPPKSYPGYGDYTSSTRGIVGYGYQTNTSFTSADYVRFKNPRDIDAYRDYFDIQNGGPTYIFVADTMNSRVQVFMNATGSAGDVGATFPIRPVPVKGPNVTDYKTNELAMRPSGGGYGDGRRADWRHYTTMPGASFVNMTAGKGEFFYPHGIAVDQDPDSKDVYLFVADTYNHRIQVFRDLSGVSSQAITAKKFNFEYVGGWGTYPLQTSETVTAPGPYNFRYPKGIDLARFKNNSSYLYVVDSKNYRVLKYKVGDAAATSGSTIGVSAEAGYGYNGSGFVSNLHEVGEIGTPLTAHGTTPGFLNPQDVAAGYSGFFLYSSMFGEGTQFLNNYMVYVTDYARNNTSITRDRLNMRVMQFIQVPTGYSNISGSWIPWATKGVEFGSYASNNLTLGQSVFGTNDGVYNSIGSTANQRGSTNNVPGVADYFTDRPVGIAALHWNTVKPIDIRVVNANRSDSGVDTANGITAYPPGGALPRSTELRIGVASRYLNFGYSEGRKGSFWNYSSEYSEIVGNWDSVEAGRVHVFCYDKTGAFSTHTALPEAPYNITLSSIPATNGNSCQSKGLVKIVAEDADFAYSARSGTVFYTID